MDLQEWITKNRPVIDAVIHHDCPGAHVDDEERRLWVMNDEGLYTWAKEEGVDI